MDERNTPSVRMELKDGGKLSRRLFMDLIDARIWSRSGKMDDTGQGNSSSDCP